MNSDMTPDRLMVWLVQGHGQRSHHFKEILASKLMESQIQNCLGSSEAMARPVPQPAARIVLDPILKDRLPMKPFKSPRRNDSRSRWFASATRLTMDLPHIRDV